MTDLTPELQAELVEFVRALANNSYKNVHQLAREIVAKLPEPPDPDIEEARAVCRAWFGVDYDPRREPPMIAALKRGRELERSGK